MEAVNIFLEDFTIFTLETFEKIGGKNRYSAADLWPITFLFSAPFKFLPRRAEL